MNNYRTILGGAYLDENVHSKRQCITWALYYKQTEDVTAPVGRMQALLAWQHAKQNGETEMFREVYLRRRASRMVWHTTTQRQWQAHCRSEARAKHHDSVAIREKYVRCVK